MVFAADTADVSETCHYRSNSGVEQAVTVGIASQNEEIPGHTVLHSRQCIANDYTAIRNIAGMTP